MENAWAQAKAYPRSPTCHLYELTTMALRDPELAADLARPGNTSSTSSNPNVVAAAIAEATGIEWSVPLPVLARIITTTLDGLVLGWLSDRDDAAAEATLTRFIDMIAGLAQPPASARI